MRTCSEHLEQAAKRDALAMQPPDHLRRVVTSISGLKARQAAKIREIREALVAEGCTSLDDQAAALGLSRSTTWTIIKGNHKASGLSPTVITRMLSAPGLPTRVRNTIFEYIAEKRAGRYGSSKVRLQKFLDRVNGLENQVNT